MALWPTLRASSLSTCSHWVWLRNTDRSFLVHPRLFRFLALKSIQKKHCLLMPGVLQMLPPGWDRRWTCCVAPWGTVAPAVERTRLVTWGSLAGQNAEPKLAFLSFHLLKATWWCFCSTALSNLPSLRPPHIIPKPSWETRGTVDQTLDWDPSAAPLMVDDLRLLLHRQNAWREGCNEGCDKWTILSGHRLGALQWCFSVQCPDAVPIFSPLSCSLCLTNL